MGGSSSKNIPKTEVENTGLLNGDLINNGQIIEKIDDDIVRENWLLLIVIILKAIHIAIIIIKWYTKKVKNSHRREQELQQILIEKNRKPEN